ncbi:baseplate J/gp47 family protein [Lichenicoccus sp.]|uniref:baseplate J/gp47 family protein n=1 Tax=Lichenicoccus sp. TaxID=2781899 RepID=UPI003D1241AB
MQLSLQNFTTLVANMAASAQGACVALLDVSVGSLLRALLESSASVALWLQYLVLQVLSMTRLSTSVGTDADSWVGDFGLTRLPAIPATGIVVMSALSPVGQSATVPTGALVKSSDGTQSFLVVGGPYLRAQGTASVSVPVQAVVAGVLGNAQAGSVTILGTAIPGIDTVTNPVAFANGAPAETDQALCARFVIYVNTRSQATEQAVANAIASVQQGLSYVIQENMTSAGTVLPGNFNVIVDDGSGSPPASLLTAVAAAIDAIRPVGSTFTVTGPLLIVADVSMQITVVDPTQAAAAQQAAGAAVTTYVDALPVGQALRISRVAGLAYDATSSISNVTDVTLNGLAADIGGQAGAVVRAGIMTILVCDA